MVHIPAHTLHDVEALEDRLQALKWRLALPRRRPAVALPSTRRSIVQRTAGALGRRHASGLVYERRLRRAWRSRSSSRPAR